MIAIYLLTLFRGTAVVIPPPSGPTAPVVSAGRPVWEDGVHAGVLAAAVVGEDGVLTAGRPVWAGGVTPES